MSRWRGVWADSCDVGVLPTSVDEVGSQGPPLCDPDANATSALQPLTTTLWPPRQRLSPNAVLGNLFLEALLPHDDASMYPPRTPLRRICRFTHFCPLDESITCGVSTWLLVRFPPAPPKVFGSFSFLFVRPPQTIRKFSLNSGSLPETTSLQKCGGT